MSDSDQERERIRAYVRKNFEPEKRKRRVVLVVVNLIITVFMAILAWLLASDSALAGMIILSVAAGLAMMFHFIGLYMETEAGARDLRRELVMKARFQRIFGMLDADEILGEEEPQKAKRDEAVRLSDDGELVSDELIEESERRDRRSMK